MPADGLLAGDIFVLLVGKTDKAIIRVLAMALVGARHLLGVGLMGGWRSFFRFLPARSQRPAIGNSNGGRV